MGALSHIRVLDLSRVLAGPWAGQILADLGADVIKVERPGCGDDTRAWGPPFLQDAAGHNTSEAAYYLSANRNKQSVTIDFTRPEGQKLVKQLAAKSDIVIENFKVGGLAAYELDYASLKAINSRLIYCSITGFGQSGPYATRPGYDFMIQALGGLMSLTGLPEGEEGAGPVKVGVALTDILTGLYSTTAILAALANRDQSNVGQHIDMALLDVQVACLANQAMNYLTTGVAPERLGNAHPNIVPYKSFPTADGDLILTVGNDSQFRKFAEVAGQSQWADDPRFLTNTLRVAHRAELIPLIRQVTVFKATAQWVAALEAVGVPCAPVNDLAQVFADPHVVARGLAIELPHALGGKVPQVASPIRLSETPVEYRRAPPMLGEHTAQVLEELLGLGSDEVASLRAAGVL
ncbi:CAIB/BAIF family protein [Pseudomonas syringae pv. actinidiae ICMP 19071]|nr:CAIB/BAIF family protein [Pseudomonas syringae pv. actinidiae ICMP 19073]EPM61990.1 CAIB/BAIF family protein [Pseudomonas syringae pv. actinidiae ICMP 19071]EPM79666.1 CAIB/BAIF family protein [Pseudomonas syringae pv. actinidiae ICMP 19072]OSN68903.1 Acetyl-CoA:oxalate CoA-transferase [Pseudomonas syringae pv. actinidiae]OSN79092.1 Acetyl-CoA:oxalate CoA-transferase [Pseudomonas syringae pv. actinidiae]